MTTANKIQNDIQTIANFKKELSETKSSISTFAAAICLSDKQTANALWDIEDKILEEIKALSEVEEKMTSSVVGKTDYSIFNRELNI